MYWFWCALKWTRFGRERADAANRVSLGIALVPREGWRERERADAASRVSLGIALVPRGGRERERADAASRVSVGIASVPCLPLLDKQGFVIYCLCVNPHRLAESLSILFCSIVVWFLLAPAGQFSEISVSAPGTVFRGHLRGGPPAPLDNRDHALWSPCGMRSQKKKS